uniref:C-type lectin domain-containing protein n=1 Tax=Syphacia muris TaxID=451379 RepID=A0A0N5AJ40_9BILA
NNGVTFITVALKEPGAAKYPLIDIASECNTFPADSHVNENLLRAFCRANCFCKDGFTQLSLGDDGCRKYGECYRVNFLPLSYNAASSACKEIGGRLPDASFEEKDNFIKDLHVSAKFFPFWISQRCDSFLSCNADRNYSIASNSYVNWCSTSYPDFSQGNCVYEDRCNEAVTGWFNADCNDITTNRFFACQIDA